MPKGTKDGSILKRKRMLPSGKIVTEYWARARYTDLQGRARELRRRARNYSDACELKRTLLDEAAEKSQRLVDFDALTFEDLATHYEEHYAVPAQYVGDRKVAGLRSLRNVEHQLAVLREHFGDTPLRHITYGELRTLRAKRLKVPVLPTPPKAGSGKPPRQKARSIATVNRELALLRRMFNIALREGWIVQNPFNAGEPLISIADEARRERILTLEEEARLLAACGERLVPYERAGKRITARDSGLRRSHLRALVITALDTGMRKGELLKLRWSDVDFDERMIRVRAFNTKTMRERFVAMTARVAHELANLRREGAPAGDPLVFGKDDVKKSFTNACTAAGIGGLRFHNLRHTAATRLVGAHISLPEVGRVLGHTQPATTYRYVNQTVESARRAAAALDDIQFKHVTKEAERECRENEKIN